jgi:transposase
LNKIVIGVESTGGYENNWYIGLRRMSQPLLIEVFRINPKRIYHEAKSEGRRSIIDGVSAAVIAGFMVKNYGKRDLASTRLEEADQEMESLRRLHKYIQRLITQNTRTKNAIEKTLYQVLPELLSLRGKNYPLWFLDLLIMYPSKKAILSAGVKGLMKINRITEDKAKDLIKVLKNSVASIDTPLEKIIVMEQAQDIKTLSVKVNRLRKELEELAAPKLQSAVNILISIRGIAADTAVGILLELGKIERFEKGKNLVAFWGINPTFKQSGDKNIYVGMSKDGSPEARSLLYMAAGNVVIHEPYFKAIYAKQRKKGKGHRAALGVIMSKLTRVIFGMLKNQTEFDAGVDTLNQLKKPIEIQSSPTQVKQTKERRYQHGHQDAPISWRQKRKRKQEEIVPS